MGDLPAGSEQFDADDVPGARQSTMRLFGGYIAFERRRRRISPEVFMERTGKTAAWLQAVERGEIILTPQMLDLIGVSFGRHGGWIDATAVVRTLEAEPYGPLARGLRSRMNLQVEFDPLESSGAVVGDGVAPVLTSIDPESRMLVLGPIVLAAVVCRFLVELVRWVETGRDVDLDWGSEVLIATSALGLFVLLLPTLDRTLRFVAIVLRGPGASTRSLKVAATRAKNGLAPAVSGEGSGRRRLLKGKVEWFAPDEQPHLLSGARSVAWRAGLRADFYERVAALSALIAIASIVCGARVIYGQSSHQRWIALGAFTVLDVALLIGFRRAAVRAGRQVLAAVSRGVGHNLNEAAKIDQELLKSVDSPPA